MKLAEARALLLGTLLPVPELLMLALPESLGLCSPEPLQVELPVAQPVRLLDRLGQLLAQLLGLPLGVGAKVVGMGDLLEDALVRPLPELEMLRDAPRVSELLLEELWLPLSQAVRDGLKEADLELPPEALCTTEAEKLPVPQLELLGPLLALPQLLELALPEGLLLTLALALWLLLTVELTL